MTTRDREALARRIAANRDRPATPARSGTQQHTRDCRDAQHRARFGRQR